MAENQSVHRQELESRVIRHNVRLETLSSTFAFVIAMTVVLGGIFLLYLDKPVAGFGTLLGGLGSLVTVFMIGRRKQQTALQTTQAAGPTAQ
jgi:uncharacterized membrane protein